MRNPNGLRVVVLLVLKLRRMDYFSETAGL